MNLGILDELTSVLQNPAFQALAPAALGAVGGGLSSPRLSGTRGAIGNALTGGAQGLEAGMRVSAEQQRIAQEQQRTQLEAQRLQDDLKSHAMERQKAQVILDDDALTTAYGKTIKDPDAAELYRREPAAYFTQTIAEKRKPANLRALKLAGMTDDQLKDFAQMDGVTLDKFTEKALDAHLAGKEDTTQKYVDALKAANPRLTTADAYKEVTHPPMFMPVTTGEGDIAAFNRRTGGVADTGVTAAPKAGMIRLEPGDDGVFHRINMSTGEDTPTTVKVPAKGGSLKEGDDGYYHLIDRKTGADRKLDVKAPPKAGGGAVTESMIAKATVDEYNRAKLAPYIDATKKWNANPFHMDDEKPPVPPPDLATWAASPEGQAVRTAMMGPKAATGTAPTGEAKPREAAGMPAGAVAKAPPEFIAKHGYGKFTKPDGGIYELRPDGYVYGPLKE